MRIAAQQPEPFVFRQIQQLFHHDKSSIVRGKFAGIVLKVSSNGMDNVTSFNISDGTGTAEASLIYKKIPADVKLPKVGDSVIVIGSGYRKILGGSKNAYSFPKIHVCSIGVITPEEQFEFSVKAALYRRETQRKKKESKTSVLSKIDLLPAKNKQSNFDTPQDKIDLRTVIMMHCYYFFECNEDSGSYVISPEMVRLSHDGKAFIAERNVTKQSMQAALLRVMSQLTTYGFLVEKESPFFVIKQELMRGIQKFFEQRILEMQDKGTSIEHLTTYVNIKLSNYIKKDITLFDWKFSQKVLKKLQHYNKIFKTSDKLVFPIRR